MVIYGKDDYINFLKKIEAKTLRYEVIGCFEDHMDMEIIKVRLIPVRVFIFMK